MIEPESAYTMLRPSSAGRTAAQSMVLPLAIAVLVAESTSGCDDPVALTVTVTGTSVGRSPAAAATAIAVLAGTLVRNRPELTVLPPADNVTLIVSPALGSLADHAFVTNMLTPRSGPGDNVQLACCPGESGTVSGPCGIGSYAPVSSPGSTTRYFADMSSRTFDFARSAGRKSPLNCENVALAITVGSTFCSSNCHCGSWKLCPVTDRSP